MFTSNFDAFIEELHINSIKSKTWEFTWWVQTFWLALYLDLTVRQQQHTGLLSEHMHRDAHDSNVLHDTAVRGVQHDTTETNTRTHKHTQTGSVCGAVLLTMQSQTTKGSSNNSHDNNIHLPPEGRRRLGKEGGKRGERWNVSLKPEKKEKNKILGRLRVGRVFFFLSRSPTF